MATNTADAPTHRRLQILDDELGPAISTQERELRRSIAELVVTIAVEHITQLILLHRTYAIEHHSRTAQK